MQFVTSGNRIAVENFTVGYLYTITFTGGEYIHCACTGIGMDFVMFSRTAPEYTFALTMETAEGVSSIDLYSEGGGTMNYNDLTNKPQINGVELTGNKTSSDIGIQPLITADNKLSYTLVSGLGTAATTASSDYATAAQGALADSAVQPADMNSALNTKQNLINSDNMLSADLVDDTSTTHKFATQTQLDQIGINENNILSVLDADGQKNVLNFNGSTPTVPTGVTMTDNGDGTYTVTKTVTTQEVPYIAAQLKAGMYILSGSPANGSDDTYSLDIRNASGQFVGGSDYGNGCSVTIPSDGWYRITCRLAASYTTTGIIIKPMLCDPALWAVSHKFEPYAMSNAEITAWILAHS